MIFLTITDFDAVIERELLYTTISYPDLEDPNAPTPEEQDLIAAALAKLDAAVNAAIAEISGYIAKRYNTEALFAQTGIQRNGIVVMKCLDITLSYLYRINSPESMTELRSKAYEMAVEWAEKVNGMEIEIPGAPGLGSDNDTTIQFGSNQKRSHHF